MKSINLITQKNSLLLFVILTFFSCKKLQKDDLTKEFNNKPIKFEKGYLTFTNFNVFSKFLDDSRTNSIGEFKRVESELGFKSLASYYDELKSKIDKCQTDVEISNLLKGYDNFFVYTEKGLEYKNKNAGIAPVIGLDGIFKIGDAYYKSLDEARIISTVKNKDLLMTINSVDDYVRYANDDIKIDWFNAKSDFLHYKEYSLSRISADPYNYGTNAVYMISTINESNNRRVYCDFISYVQYFPQYSGSTYLGFYWKQMFTLDFFHKKKGLFGWSSYTSPTYINEFSWFGVTYPPTWTNMYSGTLNSGSSHQSFTGYGFGTWGPLVSQTVQDAQNWVEPLFPNDVKLVFTGNGQNWYTNFWYHP